MFVVDAKDVASAPPVVSEVPTLTGGATPPPEAPKPTEGTNTPTPTPEAPRNDPTASQGGSRGGAGQIGDLPKWAQDYIGELRQEAKERRLALKEAQEAQGGAQGEDLRGQVAALQHELLVMRAVAAEGLPQEMGVRLQGSTFEELVADAKVLKGLFQTGPQLSQVGGGMTPPQAGVGPVDADEIVKFIREQQF